jgi:hypothetical protein
VRVVGKASFLFLLADGSRGIRTRKTSFPGGILKKILRINFENFGNRKKGRRK